MLSMYSEQTMNPLCKFPPKILSKSSPDYTKIDFFITRVTTAPSYLNYLIIKEAVRMYTLCVWFNSYFKQNVLCLNLLWIWEVRKGG